MKVSELKGFKSLRALNVFSTLVLGMKMLPSYMGETYEEFLTRVQAMPPKDQALILREGAMFVELQEAEVAAIVCFCKDKNGVSYTAENMKNLGPAELVEAIVSVCMEIAKIRIDFITENEKKN